MTSVTLRCLACLGMSKRKPFVPHVVDPRSVANAMRVVDEVAPEMRSAYRVLDLLECIPQRTGGEHLIVHIIGWQSLSRV